MNAPFFEELLIILSSSLVCMLVFQRLRLPAIIAYIVVGTLIGPQIFGWVPSAERFTFIAEFGVVFLLFSLGLEFSLPKMLALRSAVFRLGSIQVLACTAVFTLTLLWWGATLEAAIIIAGALALSSTAIVTRELSEQQQTHTRTAQLSIGVLLFQDLIAVVFLILVPVFAGSGEGSLLHELAWALGKGVLLFALLMSIGKWLLPRIYTEIARSHSQEIFVLSTLVIALLAAWLTHRFHLSMALGGFIIGMMLGESLFKHQIDTDIRPFKDILLGLFFVTLGMNIQIGLLSEYWLRLLMFTAALVIIKTLAVAAVVLMQGDRRDTALRVGLTLAQAGEFGLALIALALMNGLIPTEQASFIMLLASISMLISPALIRYAENITTWLMQKLLGTHDTPEQSASQITLYHPDHVVIGGFGRVGLILAQLLKDNHIAYVAIDNDIDLVKQRRKQGHNVLYGDSSDVKILESCHLESARLAILTFRAFTTAKATVEQIRNKGIQVPIIVRCYETGNFEELISLGADSVVPEMLEASLLIGAHVLTLLDIDATDAEKQIEILRQRALGLSAGK